MKILVTGGAGFIGSHIVDKLIQQQCRVVVVDNLSIGLREHVNAAAKLIKMDIGSPELLALFEQEKFDYVIHQAAQTTVAQSIDRPDHDCQVNIAGSLNLLEACRKTAVRRIVFASTAAAYGNAADIPIQESAPKQPTSFYGLSKWTVEQYLALYRQIFGLEYIVLRCANVYGERQGNSGEGGVISIFSKKLHERRPVTIFGDGGQSRDFIYVGDVAAANCRALTAKTCNAAFNISTGTETSLNTLVKLLEQAAGIKLEKYFAQPREGDIYRSSLDNTAAVKYLSWQPQMPLSQGLGRTYQALKPPGMNQREGREC